MRGRETGSTEGEGFLTWYQQWAGGLIIPVSAEINSGFFAAMPLGRHLQCVTALLGWNMCALAGFLLGFFCRVSLMQLPAPTHCPMPGPKRAPRVGALSLPSPGDKGRQGGGLTHQTHLSGELSLRLGPDV